MSNETYTEEQPAGLTRTEDRGVVEYRNNAGLRHRTDGPAVIDAQGNQFWCFNGEYHRCEGPALILSGGRYLNWYSHGHMHRVDGPAVIGPDGREVWYRHGKRHRPDGPALICHTESGIHAEWWVEGERRPDLEQVNATQEGLFEL